MVETFNFSSKHIKQVELVGQTGQIRLQNSKILFLGIDSLSERIGL